MTESVGEVVGTAATARTDEHVARGCIVLQEQLDDALVAAARRQHQGRDSAGGCAVHVDSFPGRSPLQQHFCHAYVPACRGRVQRLEPRGGPARSTRLAASDQVPRLGRMAKGTVEPQAVGSGPGRPAGTVPVVVPPTSTTQLQGTPCAPRLVCLQRVNGLCGLLVVHIAMCVWVGLPLLDPSPLPLRRQRRHRGAATPTGSSDTRPHRGKLQPSGRGNPRHALGQAWSGKACLA